MSNITVTFTAEELATFIDCNPSIYNKLAPEIQRTVGTMRDTPLFEKASQKLADAAEVAFKYGVPEKPYIVDALDKLAANYDLSTEEGRVAFRTMTERAFKDCKIKALREYAWDLYFHVGRTGGGPGQSRADVLRNITGTYILYR